MTVNAVCGCGRAVEAKKTFEKINYSNSTERKLRNILGTIRTQLRDNVALTKARASEAISSLRFKVELKSYEQLEMGMFWVWMNTLVYHAAYLESVGLAESVQFWITRLVKQHRLNFGFNDELRLLDLFISLPPLWLSRWASKIVKIQPPAPNSVAVKQFLFYIEMSICSVTDKLIIEDGVESEGKSEISIPTGTGMGTGLGTGTGMDRTAEIESVQTSSPNSSEFSLISDFELMGGMERDENQRQALLTPHDLNAIILQLNVPKHCQEFHSNSNSDQQKQNFPELTTNVIELLSLSIKIHSYSTLFQR